MSCRVVAVPEAYQCLQCGMVLKILGCDTPLPERAQAQHPFTEECPDSGKVFWIPVIPQYLEEVKP